MTFPGSDLELDPVYCWPEPEQPIPQWVIDALADESDDDE